VNGGLRSGRRERDSLGMSAMLGHITKLLPLAFTAYVAYEVYNLYLFCQPPVALEGASGTGVVVWDLQRSGALDLCVMLSLGQQLPPVAARTSGGTPSPRQQHLLLGVFEGITPSDTSDMRSDIHLEALDLPEAFFRNGTVFLHVLAVPHGDRGASPLRHEVVRISRQVVQPSRKIKKRYLLGGPPSSANLTRELEESAAEDAIGSAPVSSLPRVVELGFVMEPRPLKFEGLAAKGLQHFVHGQDLRLPLFVNTLVSPRDEYLPMMKGVKPPTIELRLRSVGLGYWTMQQQIGMAFDDAEKNMGMNEYDVDSFKQMIGGSSPSKIILVYTVAIAHLVFEFLAFSSDISFWRSKTSFEGISSSSVSMQALTNIIMFLYVKEQRQTKFVMYFIAFRFCLQLWKLRKLTTFRRQASFPYTSWVSRAGVESGLEEMQDIDEYERRCMRKLMLVLLPVMFAFCMYRLVHEKFRSWYSWFVLSLAVSAQIGGFVVMTPQVFMNHRLKSVEHLPWKALTYQFINTFIDDIFTWCIRMPEMQKYSAFRDDIVFVVCCVQRWMYRKPSKKSTKDLSAKEE